MSFPFATSIVMVAEFNASEEARGNWIPISLDGKLGWRFEPWDGSPPQFIFLEPDLDDDQAGVAVLVGDKPDHLSIDSVVALKPNKENK